MYQIGIISKPGRELFRVRAELGRHGIYSLHTYTDALSSIQSLKRGELSAVAVVLPKFTEDQLSLVGKLRAFQPKLPLIFLTEAPLPEIQEKVRSVGHAILVSYETDLDDLSGLFLKIIKGQNVFNRGYKRSRALQSASLIVGQAESLVHSCVLDLAGGGVRLRAFAHELKVGDKVRLKIPLSFLRKSYEVTAEVVWAHMERVSEERPTASQLTGLRFIEVRG
jgi:hypothetical protein